MDYYYLEGRVTRWQAAAKAVGELHARHMQDLICPGELLSQQTVDAWPKDAKRLERCFEALCTGSLEALEKALGIES